MIINVFNYGLISLYLVLVLMCCVVGRWYDNMFMFNVVSFKKESDIANANLASP